MHLPSLTWLGFTVSACLTLSPGSHAATEFCLDGQADLGTRLQGMYPAAGELSGSRWCVTTEDDTDRVHFFISGKSNPDMSGSFAVSYFPPDTVRIVNRDSPPDVEFPGSAIGFEALRHRRIDPRRLVEELDAHPEYVMDSGSGGWREVRYPGSDVAARVQIAGSKLLTLETTADLPLRGTVPVVWRWDWLNGDDPSVTVIVDGDVLFRAHGSWRRLTDEETASLWALSGDEDAQQVPAPAWPARTNMTLEALAENVYLVRGVRTGFHHLVIDTGEGLVVGDAPAGWVELPQIPPADLVPGLGISGLSERFLDFLAEELPTRPIRAVVLTHAHDDHAGGARAFAAAGAEVFAPAGTVEFLERALNRGSMPVDRLSRLNRRVVARAVSDRLTIDEARTVEVVNIGAGPHTSASIGLHAVEAGYFFQSDLHVPRSESGVPREDRATTECWFAAWAVDNLPGETIVISSHGSIRSPVSRLAQYLDSERCSDS